MIKLNLIKVYSKNFEEDVVKISQTSLLLPYEILLNIYSVVFEAYELKDNVELIIFHFTQKEAEPRFHDMSHSGLHIIPISLLYRSSRPEVFCKKGILRNFSKFTGKHLCQRLFLNKLQALVFFNKVACLRPATLFKKRL